MRCRSSVRQISVSSEPDRSFFLKLDWAEDLGSGFVVLLTDGVSAWSGEVSEEEVCREAQELELECERYVSDLEKALTGSGSTDEGHFSFHLSHQPRLQLQYEKVQKEISFRLGAVDLQVVPDPSVLIRELISHELQQNQRLQEQNQQLSRENQRLRSEHEHITQEMERLVRAKEELETELYGRFVLVLNEKKKKLRDLQQRVKELEETQSRKKNADAEDQEKMETEAEKSPAEESDYGGSTEDEQEAEHKRQEKPLSQEMPQSSVMDDSLSDIPDVAPCRKRRHRHLQQLEAKHTALEKRHTHREKPAVEAKVSTKQTSKTQLKPASVAANLDPDELFDDI